MKLSERDLIKPGVKLLRINGGNASIGVKDGETYVVDTYQQISSSLRLVGITSSISLNIHNWTLVKESTNKENSNQKESKMTKPEKNLALPYSVLVTNDKTGKILVNETITSRETPDRESVLVDLAVQGKIKSAKNLRVSIRSL